jgi:dihydroorotate dehydrogenase electron transfer subunit
MACGFGACMGCAIEARSNGAGPMYKLVCKDGPVFDSRELVW